MDARQSRIFDLCYEVVIFDLCYESVQRKTNAARSLEIARDVASLLITYQNFLFFQYKLFFFVFVFFLYLQLIETNPGLFVEFDLTIRN